MHALRQGVTCGVTAGVRPQASVAVPSGSVQQRKRPDADAAPALVISRRDAALAALLSTLVAPWVQPSDATAATSTSRVHWQSLAEVAEAGAAAQSSSTERIRQDYDTYAASYDELDDGALADALGFKDLRAQLLSQAKGQVLEVAVGTGLNLQFYDYNKVQQLTAIDLSSGMLDQARARVSRQLPGRPISFVQADATQLPLEASSFDCVVDTFSLCVIPDPAAAVAEMARVVRPGGRVLLLEHVRSDNPLLAAYQDASASAVAATAKGCVWNQDVPALARAAGLRLVSVSRYTGGTIAMIQAVKDA